MHALKEQLSMAKVVIVTDSVAYIPKELLTEYGIRVAPQILVWGDENYLDGVDILPTEFYTRLAKAKIMPGSSQVTPAIFYKMFKEELDEGCDILAVLVGEKLSGTIASAMQARELLHADNIEIFDSENAAMAMGFQALEAARAAQAGAGLAECKAVAEKARQHVGVVFAVNTLEFLHRGGRIGGGARFLGTALNIKPILEIRDGRVEAVERVRTRSRSLARLVELVDERTKGRRPIHIATLHANAEDEARELLKTANETFSAVECILSEVSPVVGTHAGPGTVGLAYLAGM
jgi:DegV family protein with EDD domain